MDMPDPHAPPFKAGPWMKLSMKIGGATEARLKQCPPEDWDNVRAIAEIQMCVWLYQAGLFSLIGHRLFAAPGQIRPDIVVVAAFLATMITAIDSYVIMRSGWHLEGLKALARGGLDISGGVLARLKAGIFLCVRISLSIGLAQLTAIFVGTLIYAKDIDAQIQAPYLKANAHLVGPATALADDGIKRTTDAVTTQTKRVNDLAGQIAALRQVEIDPDAGNPEIQEAQRELTQLIAERASAENAVQIAETFEANEFGGIKGAPGNSGKAGKGLRYQAALQETKNAKDHALELTKELNAARARLDALRKQMPATDDSARQRAREQLPGFEKALAAENEKLTKLKNELAALTAGRDAAIRQAIENAPDHVAYDGGFLRQLTILENMAEQDRKILAIILLIDFVSFGFELAAVLAKITSFVPSTYAMLLARDAYIGAVRVVNEMMDELNGPAREEPDASGFPAPVDPTGGAPGSGGAAIPHPVLSPDEGAPPEQPESPVAATPAPPQPLKRGRGRPRIHPVETHPPRKRPAQKHSPLTVITGGIGPGQQQQPPEQPAPT